MRELTMPTGKALRDAVDALNTAMCHGKDWRISIPPDARDYDMLIHEMRNAHEAQERRIAELESQLALALPAQRFAGAMLESIGSDSTTLNATDVQVCDALGESGLQLKTLRLRDRLTQAGEAALAAWRASQTNPNDTVTP